MLPGAPSIQLRAGRVKPPFGLAGGLIPCGTARRFKLLDVGLDIGALALEVVGDRAAQAGIDDVVRRIGGLRHIAAGKLVLALRAGLHTGELVRDRIFDRLIVADLEMQKRMVLDASPMAAEQRVASR